LAPSKFNIECVEILNLDGAKSAQ